MLRFLIKSSFLWSAHQNHFKFATWIYCIIPINMYMICSWYILWFSVFSGVFQCFYLEKCGLIKMLRFLKSRFLWSSHQNHFKFATWIHCIILINMCRISSWYILSFFCIFGVLSLFFLKSWLLSSFNQNHFTFGTCFHCIILINMLVFTSWYIL